MPSVNHASRSGLSASRGKALGPLHFDADPARDLQALPSLHGEEAKRAFLGASQSAEDALKALASATGAKIGKEEGEIFSVQALLVSDPDFQDGVLQALDDGFSLREALVKSADAVCRILEETGDDYMRRRTGDVMDVRNRIARILAGKPEEAQELKVPHILAALDLTPSRTASLDPSLVLGIVTEQGAVNGHTAILCRTLGIPAVVSLGPLDPRLEGCEALLSGDDGILVLSPSAEEKEAYQRETEEKKADAAALSALIDAPDVTRDGRALKLYANAASPEEIKSAIENGARGIGLFRSERLFLSSSTAPDEQAQLSLLLQCIDLLGTAPLIIRTLDIGADKLLPYLPMKAEDNPALGVRGIRFSLAKKDLFRTQLRAILRAAEKGNVHLMFPMITEVREIREAKQILHEVKQELQADSIPHALPQSIGIMIETPAAALIADALAPEVDFFSIGTNDLIQYTLAADRQNPTLAPLFRSPSPAVFSLIEMTLRAAKAHGIWCGVCGEMASELHCAARLIQMGVDELSVVPPLLLPLRRLIRES